MEEFENFIEIVQTLNITPRFIEIHFNEVSESQLAEKQPLKFNKSTDIKLTDDTISYCLNI